VRAEVAVVIPTRNRWALLPRALGSALAQAGVSIEVVVVDDGSDAPPPAIPALEDSRVRLVRAPHRGVAAARNAGIDRTTSPWVSFLDDDDIWAPDRLASLLRCAEAAQADLAYSRVLTVDGCMRPLFEVPAPPPDALAHRLLRFNAIPGGGSNVLARTEAVVRLGGFDDELSFVADWDLWLRLAQQGPAAASDRLLMAYSVHAGSWVLSGDPAVTGDFDRMAEKHPHVVLDRLNFERWRAFTLLLTGRQPEARRAYLATARRHGDPKSLLRAGSAVLPRSVRRRLRPRRVRHPDWLPGGHGVRGP
jgi:glycosyltransferase involved in cell wall biosynthesis